MRAWPMGALNVMAIAVMAIPGALSGQAGSPGCSYDTCALRIRTGVFSGGALVRGVEEERIAGLGFIVGSLDSVFEGSPVAQDLAATYRSRKNTGTIMSTIGLTGLVVGILSLDGYDDSAGAVFWGGFALSLAGGLTVASSADHLSRAVWEYNRTLERAP